MGVPSEKPEKVQINQPDSNDAPPPSLDDLPSESDEPDDLPF